MRPRHTGKSLVDLIRSYRNERVRYMRRPIDLWLVLGGLLVLVVCMFIVRSGEVAGVEEAVFHAINGLPDFLQAPMWLLQIPGILVFPLAVALAALLLRRYRLAAAIALTVPLKLLLERRVVKVLVERQRPGTSVSDAILRDASPTGLSFPSGHAILAFALARIYLGAHNALDVVGGAGLGIAIAGAPNPAFGVPDQPTTGHVAEDVAD